LGKRHSAPRNGKKKKDEWRRSARSSCPAAGDKIPEKKAERIFNLMEEFAGYGFNNRTPVPMLCWHIITLLENTLPVEFMRHFSLRKQGYREGRKYINERVA